jgi:hypothetical protein
MGSSEFITTGGNSRVESTSLTKLFEHECPYYMSYGMSFDQFWYDSPWLAKFYRESYKLKIRYDNVFMWKQGMYIYEALCDVSPILHAFSKKGAKPLQYRSKPMSEEYKEMRTDKEKEISQKNEQLKARIFFERWARATAKHFENENK